MATSLIKHADLTWNDQEQPYSPIFDDIYFSTESGLEETRHVFIQHNQLIERFKQLKPYQHFVIGETGFGTGLNFLCAWQCFKQHAPKNAQLHFISTELYPLTKNDLTKALSLWDELADLRQILTAQYLAIHAGYQHFSVEKGIKLTLLIGDAITQLSQFNGSIDAWFLDGFSPAKNPTMWTPALFNEIARLSKQNTTFATFTSAGFVRRALTESGFTVHKTAGFAHKREMLYGVFNKISSIATPLPKTPPWYQRLPPSTYPKHHALIIGAGIAGCATAASLAERGWQVTVLEQREAVAKEGSGNTQGILYLKLSAHQTLQTRLLLEGFGYTRRCLEVLTQQGLLQQGDDWDNCGVIQLAFDDREAHRQQQLAQAFEPSLLYPITQEQAHELANVPVNHHGLFFPEGCWVKPRQLCKALLLHPNIQVKTHQHIVSLKKDNGQWQAWDRERCIDSADIIVLANAADVTQFPVTNTLPVKRIRGQTTLLPTTPSSAKLSTVVCSDGYISPPRDNQHCLGANFNFHATDLLLSPAEHTENLETLKTISAELADYLHTDQLDTTQLKGHAAYRCTATDYLPLVGPIANREAFLQDYKVLIKDSKKIPSTTCQLIDGIFLNIAHGSRGMITAPLCGELLAAWINNEPSPIEHDLLEACHPNRFYMRELKYYRRDMNQ